MRITILCSSKEHPIYPYLEKWNQTHSSTREISLINEIQEITYGDILFLISVKEIVKSEIRKKFTHSLVIHASDLPEGRGWSPVVWQVLQGSKKITVTLFEAIDKVDSGEIWKKQTFELEGNELYDEINEKLFETEFSLMDFALENTNKITPSKQPDYKGTYFEKRKPEDSELDVNKTIAEQFDLMRIADVNRYPNFFKYRNHRYKLTLRKF